MTKLERTEQNYIRLFGTPDLEIIKTLPPKQKPAAAPAQDLPIDSSSESLTRVKKAEVNKFDPAPYIKQRRGSKVELKTDIFKSECGVPDSFYGARPVQKSGKSSDIRQQKLQDFQQ